MLTCTSRFVAVLTRLISAGLHSPNSPKSEAATWDAISETIKTVAELEPPLGAHPNIIRRDVLMSHGYSGQADLVFELINNSSVNLQHLYVSPSDTNTWGEDILGLEILASGEVGTVTIADGLSTCAYDLLFVTDTGNEVTSSQDLCVLNTFTLND